MTSAANRSELEKLFSDDVPYGDLTTIALGIGDQPAAMTFRARDEMVLAEAESAAGLLEIAGCKVKLAARSGTKLNAGAPILDASGTAAAIHQGWKVAQTLIEIWSGVATAARAIVDAAATVSPDIVVACTRKNVPGVKAHAVRAVRAGGAVMHRQGLSETILVFPEHRVFLGSEPLLETAKRLRQNAPEKKLVMEATSVEDALAGAAAGFDVIQAEKFSPAMIETLHRDLGALGTSEVRPLIAAAGGINAENAAAYAEAGANILVTSSPYLARPRDVQVTISK